MYPVASTSSQRSQFSTRERDVVAELAQGYIVKDIANHLGLAVNTVKDYLKSIYAKAEVHSARELMVRLYGNPESELRRQRHIELLRALETLLGADGLRGLVGALAAAAAACLQAPHTGAWLAGEAPGRTIFLPASEGGRQMVLRGGFVPAVVADGYRLHPGTAPRSRRVPRALDSRELAALGLDEHVLGVNVELRDISELLAPQPARQQRHMELPSALVLLVSRPAHTPFSDYDVGAARLLGRVAELQARRIADDHRTAMRRGA